MCAIFGIYSEFISKKELQSKLINSLRMLKHRGPDSSSHIINNAFASGVNRLAIESIKYGQQPIEDDRYVVGFNGEIFNYKEIIKNFFSNSKLINSEIKLILELWRKKKEKFVNIINGQYAIFIFDKQSKEIFLFRDPFGIRPVYYSHDSNQFVFSSEMKAIVNTNLFDHEINEKSISQTCLFWTNIGSNTALTNIKILEPGFFLKWKNGKVVKGRFYNFPFFNQKTFENIDRRFLFEQLKSSINRQIHGEVEFGCYISGGIDSSSLAYLLSEKRKINTFSISFEDEDYDESNYQNELIKIINSKHRSLNIKKQDISKNFKKVINHSESLLFRTAPVPMYLLSKLVKDSGIKVIYSGEGADEILFGYDIFFENRIRNFWKKFPKSNIRPQLLRKLYNYLPQFSNPRYINLIKDFYINTLAKDSFDYSHLPRWEQFKQVSSYFNLKKINTDNMINNLKNSLDTETFSKDSDYVCQQIEIQTLLSNYLLSSQGDRMTMANSVEGRYPFLDEVFVSNINSYSSKKISPLLKSKNILRESFKNFLPRQLVFRPKTAYQAPEASSFVSSNYISEDVIELQDTLKDLDYLNEKNTLSLIDKFKDEFATKRSGFRENMSLVIALSYMHLKNHVQDWKKWKS